MFPQGTDCRADALAAWESGAWEEPLLMLKQAPALHPVRAGARRCNGPPQRDNGDAFSLPPSQTRAAQMVKGPPFPPQMHPETPT